MRPFEVDADLEIGNVFEVAGSALKIALSKNIRELTRSHSGRVYDVGQLGSILKLHMGRRLIFCTVRLLRLQTDEEAAAIVATSQASVSQERRVIEADLLGEAWWNTVDSTLAFSRGVSTYPLPLQGVHLVTKAEGEQLFSSAERTGHDGVNSLVEIGDYVGATRIACHANVDKLFGQHCAILGSTGSGKSSAVSVILHAALQHRPRGEDVAHHPQVIIIDPHGEYSSAFPTQSIVYRAYDNLTPGVAQTSNLRLPYWLLSGDEFRSLVIGKTEFEATSQANIVYKALSHARMVQAGLARSAIGPIPADLPAGIHPEEPLPITGTAAEVAGRQLAISGFDRDKPRPFKLAEFRAHILNRQAYRSKGAGWEPVTPSEFQKDYASILNKFSLLVSDPRIAFLMSELADEPATLTEILRQFFFVQGDADVPVRIIDISGLPNEVAGPLTGAIARLVFQYKVFQSREERERDPILFVCEEAHRYVPNRGEAQYAVAQDAIRRIAREGRKYGIGLMLVSQRPADVEGTVISQCNSWIVLRLSNSNDQEHVGKFLPDSLSGMTRMLSALQRQEALFVGEAAAIPARIRLKTLGTNQLPNSNDISFAAGWSGAIASIAQIGEVADRMQN